MSDELNLFIPITKVDEQKRLVYGEITSEGVDKSGEAFDYDSSKPFYEKWSGDISEATGGKSVGNLRAMHTGKVAGKLTQIHFDDATKRISCAAKVIDDAEWALVLEGAYTGFSQGGRYKKRWTGEDGVKRYTVEPHEVSLVDNPCLSSARFELVKADGSTEAMEFKKTEEAGAPAAEPNTAPADHHEAPITKQAAASETKPEPTPVPSLEPSSTTKASATSAPVVTKREMRMSEPILGDVKLDLQKANLPSSATAGDFVEAAYVAFAKVAELEAENRKLLDAFTASRVSTAKLKEIEGEALIKSAVADDKIDASEVEKYQELYKENPVLCAKWLNNLQSRKYLRIRQGLNNPSEGPNDPDSEVQGRAAELMAKNSTLTQAAAESIVLKSDLDLSRRYNALYTPGAPGSGGAR